MNPQGPIVKRDIRQGVLLPHWIEHPEDHADLIGMRVVRPVPKGEQLSLTHLSADHDTAVVPMTPDDYEPLGTLDSLVFAEMGTAFSDSAWSAVNYGLPLDRKTELSFVAKDGPEVVACWVASQTIPGDAHTHRVVIHPDYRKRGLFQRLFCASWRATLNGEGMHWMLGETRESNTVAIKSYEGVGLRLMTAEEVARYLQARKRTDHQQGPIIIDEQGLRSVGIISTPEHGLERTG